MSKKTEIPLQLRRRTHLLDKVIDNLLPNMYPCDYNSSDHFVEGVLDEIRWFLLDFEELRGIERKEIENYILDYKYDELTEYFNERCIVLKNDKLQENIRRLSRENSLKNDLMNLIDNVGLKKASKAVGGMVRLLKILDLDQQEINNFIYQYLKEEFYPDYNWGPELHDFYKKEIEQYGIYDFLINDDPAYSYLGEWDGYEYLYTLSIGKLVRDELTKLFGDKWIPIFKKWFEENSGLEVREIDLNNKFLVY